MKRDDSVRSVLEAKGSTIHSVGPDAPVFSALAMMAEHDIGALLVTEAGRPAGILSERDYARKVILLGRNSMETSVQEVMSRPVCVLPDDSIDSCLHLMTQMRVRHLVVVDGERIAGLVSIGDLVNSIISRQNETISHLHNYVAAGYPG